MIDELRNLIHYGIHRFFFSNSEFNLYLSYALALCRSLAAAGLGRSAYGGGPTRSPTAFPPNSAKP